MGHTIRRPARSVSPVPRGAWSAPVASPTVLHALPIRLPRPGGPPLRRPARRGVRAHRRPSRRRARRARHRPTATVFYPSPNVAASSRVYTIDPKTHLRADRDAEDRGLEIIGVMHSHTHTEPYPSPTDVAQAPDPSWHYVIVSFRAGPAGAALVPDRRRRDRRGAGRAGRRGRIPTRPVDNLSARDGPTPSADPSLRKAPMAVYSSVLEMIGDTPMVDVSVLSPNPTCASSGRWRARTPPGRSRTASPSR